MRKFGKIDILFILTKENFTRYCNGTVFGNFYMFSPLLEHSFLYNQNSIFGHVTFVAILLQSEYTTRLASGKNPAQRVGLVQKLIINMLSVIFGGRR